MSQYHKTARHVNK